MDSSFNLSAIIDRSAMQMFDEKVAKERATSAEIQKFDQWLQPLFLNGKVTSEGCLKLLIHSYLLFTIFSNETWKNASDGTFLVSVKDVKPEYRSIFSKYFSDPRISVWIHFEYNSLPRVTFSWRNTEMYGRLDYPPLFRYE